MPSLITAPGRLFTGPDSELDGAPGAPSVWRLLVGNGLGPGLPPLWLGITIFGLIWLVALVGLARHPDRRTVLAAWITAVVAFGMAIVLSRLVVSVPPVGAEVRPWVGAYLLVGFGALILGGGVGVDGLSTSMKERSFSWLQPMTVLAGVLVGLVSIGAAAWWVLAGASGPIERTRLDAIPPYVLNAMTTEARPRVLAIDLSDGTAHYSVLADDLVRLGDADRGLAFGGSATARTAVDDLVVRLVAGTADSDIVPQLSDLGIGYIWVTGATDDVTSRIDNTPGLGVASGNDQGTVWELEPAVSRAVIAGPDAVSPVGGSAGDGPGRRRRPTATDRRGGRSALAGRARRPPAGTGRRRLAAGVQPAARGRIADLSSCRRSPAGWSPVRVWCCWSPPSWPLPAVRRPEVRDPTRSARRAATLSETV